MVTFLRLCCTLCAITGLLKRAALYLIGAAKALGANLEIILAALVFRAPVVQIAPSDTTKVMSECSVVVMSCSGGDSGGAGGGSRKAQGC